MQPQPYLLLRVEGLETLQGCLVGTQAVRGLGPRVLGIPRIPDRDEGIPSGRLLSGQACLQEQAEDLGPGAEVGEHLGDRPLTRVRPLLQLGPLERSDQGLQPVVGVPQRADPRVRAGFHHASPLLASS